MTDSETPQESERTMDTDTRQLGPEQFEHAVLMEMVALLPAHPTLAELQLAVSGAGEDPETPMVEDSLFHLRRFGLVRENGKVLEPTLAALHATELIQRFL
jgi:hypothetical protein